jgi:hypothetical protein
MEAAQPLAVSGEFSDGNTVGNVGYTLAKKGYAPSWPAAQRIVGFWLNPPWLCLIRKSEGSRASPRSAAALGRKESARHQRHRQAHRR